MGIQKELPPHLFFLWAKTEEGGPGSRSFHPLFCHMADVAAVALALWQDTVSAATRNRIAAALGWPANQTGHGLAFWAALHDLGKASPAFAFRYPVGQPVAAKTGLPRPSRLEEIPHGKITAVAARDLLVDLGYNREAAQTVATAIGGHHGLFPSGGQPLSAVTAGGPRWQDARRSLMAILTELLEVSDLPSPNLLDHAQAMFLAGLVSVADWIGSATEYFAFAVTDAEAPPSVFPDAYFDHAKRQAQYALKRLGWIGWAPPAGPSPFQSVFPTLLPRPLQLAVSELAADLQGPSLVIVEAPMGEGKTEAALYLADYWSAVKGQRGCYFALPTQATSNQIFSRVREFLGSRYPVEIVNLQLLHGHASLSAEFQALRQEGDRLFAPEGIYADDEKASEKLGVVATEWFTRRKRGLLAPFGVGTVDQALLAVLQTKHVFVRLFGLGQKTLIIDEVHAYDTYMSTLLERLLEWLGALGSPVILLSATLPKSRRLAMLEAYRHGSGSAARTEVIETAPYPRLTWVAQQSAGNRALTPRVEGKRTVHLKWVDGRQPPPKETKFALGENLQEALTGGGCAVVICNTVSRAQQVFLALLPYFPGLADDGLPELDLFHARYLFADRDRREKRALIRYGKAGARVEGGEGEIRDVQRPKRSVLVATQVVEQSLDLDFDLLVSDIAPVDLLLQRSGRLHRHEHERPAGLAEPQIWICLPEGMDGVVPNFGKGNTAVYEEHVLLRTWLVLQDRQTLAIPSDLEPLIEAVYEEAAAPTSLDQALADRWNFTAAKLREQRDADRLEAVDRWLKQPSYDGPLWRLTGDPREEDAPDFHQAHQALTRLSEPTVHVACLFGSTASPTLDREGKDVVDPAAKPTIPLAKELLLRSAAMSDRRVIFTLLAQPVPAGWSQSALLCHHRLLVLDQDGKSPCGPYIIRLDDELGLLVETSFVRNLEEEKKDAQLQPH